MNQDTLQQKRHNQFSERDWDKLITHVIAGNVVPVIGAELLSVTGDDGNPVCLYEIWRKALARQMDLQVSHDGSVPLLYCIANQISQNQTGDFDLTYDIDCIVRQQTWPMPESLGKLAEIGSFPLFVTTTIDHMMKCALDEALSSHHRSVKQIVFRPHGDKTKIDLPENFENLETPTVFHLFGASHPTNPEEFSRTEDDLIEFSWSLIDQQFAPSRLYSYLRRKMLLLIGCNFPDWLGRFLIYALHVGRHESFQHARSIYYVSSIIESGLEAFLKRKHATVVNFPHPNDFVNELHSRWRNKKPQSEQKPAISESHHPTSIKRGAVFLSYAKEDRDAVLKIKKQLEAANIDNWMDESELEPGDEFQNIIHNNIR
ncbi:MAG: toll/interleukin-1 receptor domain-containing protein, partial [Nitrospirae bacterium]|nr:toll/interleukin-1 receptor domain-containing protein [Nitrospirota bacterium]